MRFRFNSPNKHFTCTMHGQPCGAKLANGGTCRRRVVIGLPRCFSHLERDRSLRIKVSTVPGAGRGLFAYNRRKQRDKGGPGKVLLFKPRQVITELTGEVIPKNVTQNRYGNHTAPYATSLSSTKNINSACRRGVGAMINTHLDRTKWNCVLAPPVGGKIYVKATKPVHHDEELFCDYSNEYILHEPHTSHATKRR